ncbi:MAG: DMT family transporter [Pseudomonadota bacterium]
MTIFAPPDRTDGSYAARNLPPILVTAAAIALFSIMDAVMKRASLASGVYSALLLRSVLGAAVLGPLWLLSGARAPRGPLLRLHALRGVLHAGMAVCFFWGVVRTPLAEGIALSFIAPLIALYLAAVQLGETIRREAILASLCGLGGVIVIAATRIGGSAGRTDAGWGIAAILLSALLYAWNLVLQRRQAQMAGPLEVALSQNLFIALSLAPFAPLLWRQPGPGALADIAIAAMLVSSSLMLLAWAYARAQAQVLVPIEYTAFGWSALMGWLWFAEPVTASTLAGLALILVGVWLGTRRGPELHTPPA